MSTADSITSMFPQRLLEDLATSGLLPNDVRAKPLEATHKAALQTPHGLDGYGIPYYDINGKPIAYYRAKLYDAPSGSKYRQPPETQNHVYFPPLLHNLLRTDLNSGSTNPKYLLVTEGEKKAARAVKAGIPCVAFGGVDSWKTRTLVLPKDTNVTLRPDKKITAKLPSGSSVGEGGVTDTLAVGLQDIIDYSLKYDVPLIIVYDSDTKNGPKHEVLRAAAQFGFELRFRGLPSKNIRQLFLPTVGFGDNKVGLDDFLEEGPNHAQILKDLIQENLLKKSAFPRHPNIREYVARRLAKTQLPRTEQNQVALAILADLDSKGSRLYSPDESELYYFNQADRRLMKVNLDPRTGTLTKSDFGILLYNEYGVSVNDLRILGWLSTLFSGEQPVSEVHPEKVMTWRGDTMYYQINDGTMARVTKDHIDFLDNGTDNVLFVSGLTADIDQEEVLAQIKTQAKSLETKAIPNKWYEVLKEARVQEVQGDLHRRLLSLLYYTSPWMYRWRGTQLPVEITTGEAGAGKSTLYELRLSIFTGISKLRNPPADLRDWASSLANSGGLHVTDNVQLTNNDLRQRLSDEICRLVTEPNPTIEQRKLYSDSTQVQIPVKCVFGITAIRQPFTNIDIIQRSIITELDKGTSSDLRYDANWKEHQVERFGGRAAWVAHHILFVQRLLQLVDKHWINHYQAKYRLINVEQLLMIADQVFGSTEEEAKWVPAYLEKSRDSRASETDWALEGLMEYVATVKAESPGSWLRMRFAATSIASWAEHSDEFKGCNILTNPRSLGRYIQQHKNTVATTVGIIPLEDSRGRSVFGLQEVSSDADYQQD